MKTKVLYIPDQKSASFDQKIVNFFRNICDWDVQIFDEPFSNINVERANEIFSDEFEMVVGVGTGSLTAEFIETPCSKILIDPLDFVDWIWSYKRDKECDWDEDRSRKEFECLQEKFSWIDDERRKKTYKYITPYNQNRCRDGQCFIIGTRPTVRINEGGVVFDGRWFEEGMLEIMEKLNYHLRPEGKMN